MPKDTVEGELISMWNKANYLQFFFLFLLYGNSFAQSGSKSPYKLFFEKVYLHTDRELYSDGEDIWFKAYLVNGQTHQLINSSNNLYVELISPEAKISERKLIRLDNGLGNGDFHLKDSIAPGTYRLRAYTSWMRNFGDQFIFEKEMRVVSAGGELKLTAETEKGKSLKPKAESLILVANKPQPKTIIRFFPEGGSLIEGVAGVLAFKTEDAYSKGISVNGSILSSSGEQAGVFSCDSSGIGSLFFTPLKGEMYKAEGTFGKGEKFSVELPKALIQGYSIFVRQNDSLIRATVSTNLATLEQQQGKPLVILAKSKGKTVYTASFSLTGLQQTISISKSTFPEGISALTLYDGSGKPQCERLVYVEGKGKAILKITTDKTTYSPKGKVTVSIKATDENNQPIKANLSLSAVDAGMIPVNEQHIVSYLNLSSEIKGTIQNPDQYFDVENPNRSRSLDLLLLTQGWRDFVWKQLADTTLNITYPAEQGITISGRVQEGGGKLVVGANITLSAPGAKGMKLFSGKTDSTGHYYFDAVDLYGSQSIRLSSRDSKGQKNGVIILDSLFVNAPLINGNLLKSDIKSISGFNVATTELLKRKETTRKLSVSDTINLKEVKLNANRNTIRLSDMIVQSGGYPDEIFNVDPKDYDHRDVYHYLQHYSKAQVGDVRFKPAPSDLPEPLTIVKPGKEHPLDPPYEYHNLLYYYVGGNYVFPRLVVNGREMPFTDEPREYESMMAHQKTYFSLPVDKVKKIVIKRTIAPPRIIQGGSSTTNAFGASVESMGSLSPMTDLYIVYLTLKEDALDPVMLSLVKADVTGYYESRTFYKPVYESISAKADVRSTIHWEPQISTNKDGEASFIFYNADPKTRIRIVAEGISQKGVPITGLAQYEVK